MRSHMLFLALVLETGCGRTVSPAPEALSAQPVTQTPPVAAAPVAPAEAEAESRRADSLVVQSPGRPTPLGAGDEVPAFSAITHDGRRVSITQGARERVLVVYFYPRDETPGCTREACSLRDAFQDITEAGAEVIGVSTDTLAAHRAFAEHHRLPFGLVSDPDGRLASAFGLQLETGTTPRMTFVIGRNGHVARVFPNVRVDIHGADVLEAIGALR